MFYVTNQLLLEETDFTHLNTICTREHMRGTHMFTCACVHMCELGEHYLYSPLYAAVHLLQILILQLVFLLFLALNVALLMCLGIPPRSTIMLR